MAFNTVVLVLWTGIGTLRLGTCAEQNNLDRFGQVEDIASDSRLRIEAIRGEGLTGICHLLKQLAYSRSHKKRRICDSRSKKETYNG